MGRQRLWPLNPPTKMTQAMMTSSLMMTKMMTLMMTMMIRLMIMAIMTQVMILSSYHIWKIHHSLW